MVWLYGKCETCDTPLEEGKSSPCDSCTIADLRKQLSSSLTSKQVYRMVRGLLEFPLPQICRHTVAFELLSILESNGCEVSQELSDAIVRADDETALELLPEEG